MANPLSRPTTNGTLLGGQIRYLQYADGYRTGVEPVLLAAAMQASGTDTVLEAGTGAGAALLCLAKRVPGITGVGVELDAELTELAGSNARANGWHERLRFEQGAIETFAAGPGRGIRFDVAIANPPWHAPSGTVSAEPGRALAKRAMPGSLHDWLAALAGCLCHRGRLGVIVPPGLLPAAMASLTELKCGSFELLPLWPKPNRPARIVILRAIRGGRSPMAVLAGLTLHTEGAFFTDAANRVLIAGEALG